MPTSEDGGGVGVGVGVVFTPELKVKAPLVVIRPIVLLPVFVNQRAPSRPAVIPDAYLMPRSAGVRAAVITTKGAVTQTGASKTRSVVRRGLPRHGSPVALRLG